MHDLPEQARHAIDGALIEPMKKGGMAVGDVIQAIATHS
jgi:hypothetical protein